MTDPGSVMVKLDKLADELDAASKSLSTAEDALEPLTERYAEFIDNYETGLWDAHENEDAKLPSEAMREKLAKRSMRDKDSDTLGGYLRLTRERKKLERRIASLKSSVSAQQSILSALKEEMAATR